MTVTIHDTPAAQAVAKATQTVKIDDAQGRRIVLRKPGVLAQFRLIEALGPTASNEVYMAMVLPLIFVTEIGGEIVPPPTIKVEVEALIQRLGEDGIKAVMEGVQKHFKASTPEQDKAALKNA